LKERGIFTVKRQIKILPFVFLDGYRSVFSADKMSCFCIARIKIGELSRFACTIDRENERGKENEEF